jgi:hypothetical protein
MTVACYSAVPAGAASAAPHAALQASIIKKIMTPTPPRPSPPDKLIKTPIRVNPEACGVCDVCTQSCNRCFLAYIQ